VEDKRHNFMPKTQESLGLSDERHNKLVQIIEKVERKCLAEEGDNIDSQNLQEEARRWLIEE